MRFALRLKYKGETYFFDGKNLNSSLVKARKFASHASAAKVAKSLNRQHSILKRVRLRVVKLVRKNPSGFSSAVDTYVDELDRADDLLYDFSGMRAHSTIGVNKTPIKRGLVVGKLSGVMYSADRGEGVEDFFHRFRKKSRPLLVADSDGSQIEIVGGRYRFTEKGIEDR